MSAGIVSFGAYVPMYRLSMDTIAQTWGGPPGKGEKAVANWDEDSLTMATEAAIDCLNGTGREAVDGLYFATTTPPYREKQNASIIGKVLDLRRDISTMDVTNSMRGATSAMKAALDAVNAGSAKKSLVVASDCRVAAPSSQFEKLFGDGAASVLIGDSDVAVEIEGSHSISSDFVDIWRTEKDKHVQTWEDRFVIQHGYVEHLVEAITGLLKKYSVAPGDFSKIVYYAYDQRRHGELARKMGLDPKSSQIQNPLLDTVGHTGAASALMMLVAALEDAKPGDKILFANYGDGVDAYILKVTSNIEKLRDRRGIAKNMASKMPLPNYGKYLKFRDLMEWERQRQPDKYASLTMSWRDRNWVLSCHGHKCKECGTIQFPLQRVCTWCQAKDNLEEVRLSDKKGTLFTYSMDNLAVSIDSPNVVAIVDLEGGGRFSTTLTDRDPEKVTPDMPVELTFRKVHEGQELNNYFWKCRPIRA